MGSDETGAGRDGDARLKVFSVGVGVEVYYFVASDIMDAIDSLRAMKGEMFFERLTALSAIQELNDITLETGTVAKMKSTKSIAQWCIGGRRYIGKARA